MPDIVAKPVIVAPERERKEGLGLIGYPGLRETPSHKKYSPCTRLWVQHPAQENETIMITNLKFDWVRLIETNVPTAQ